MTAASTQERGAAGVGDAMAGRLLVLAPLRLEARAVRAGARDAHVLRTGMGARWARRAAEHAAGLPGDAVAVSGFAGALDAALAAGELVVATELRGAEGGTVPCAGAELLAGLLRRRGLPAHAGPLASVDHVVHGPERERLRAEGAVAVDMESAWLAAAAGERPFAVVRAVVDGPTRELHRPLATAAGAMRALRALRAAGAVLEEWADAVRPRRVVLAGSRASCAGVERAVRVVELALAEHGAPVHVRRQIVHNAHVVADLEARGAVFVSELDEVPDGATVVFSAHGVAPSVRAEARERGLRVIDATCPLVAKVHGEARRFARRGYTIVLVGHEGHDEVEGTVGEAPDRIRLVDGAQAVEALDVEDAERVAYLTQTTLAVDETRDVVDALRARFPAAVGPPSDDICYATQNRQDAVRSLAARCDLILVVGSRNSSNANRLVEVAQRHGGSARLVEDESAVEPAWLVGAETVGVTAGASTPEALVQRVVRALTLLGPLSVHEDALVSETMRFKLPPGLRPKDH